LPRAEWGPTKWGRGLTHIHGPKAGGYVSQAARKVGRTSKGNEVARKRAPLTRSVRALCALLLRCDGAAGPGPTITARLRLAARSGWGFRNKFKRSSLNQAAGSGGDGEASAGTSKAVKPKARQQRSIRRLRSFGPCSERRSISRSPQGRSEILRSESPEVSGDWVTVCGQRAV